MIKINFGSGPFPLPGWVNVDLNFADRPDVVADLSRALPFATACADYVHTEDFIAQLDPEPLAALLREWRRILKPSGALRVLTPDLDRFMRMYLESPAELIAIWNASVGVPLPVDTACSVVNLGMRLAGRFQYDRLTFTRIANAAGFDVEAVTYNESRHPELRGLDLRRPAESVSMYLECVPHGG